MRRRLATILVFYAAAFAAQNPVAQAPVVESYGTAVGGAATSDYGPAAASASTINAPGAGRSDVTELFQLLQALQIEVQELRGLIEEQHHQLNRLAREQNEQYLDIDRRLRGQSSGAGGGSSRVSDTATGSTGTIGSGERDAYTRAFDLIQEKRFQEAIDGFKRLIVDYPNGPYTPNSFYWLGELYLILPEPELETSRQRFVQVVDLYPSHRKVPDALYKLGVVYGRLGEQDRAREYLSRVQSEYPDSPAARLAKLYAAELR
ncbi:MAG: tol-pal system protein YbgF [Chloroflexi bacterium]|nr:MAG: tol-pal system protein YbgF [Chloroflexota bacterium]